MKQILHFIPLALLMLFPNCASVPPEDTGGAIQPPPPSASQTEEVTLPAENTAEQPETEDSEMNTIIITVNGSEFSAELYDNPSAKELARRLPAALDMRELNGNEKYYYFDESFPSDSRSVGQITAGDIMLYGSDCLVIFYESFSTQYSYTPLGRITDASGLAKALGTGAAKVTLSLG